MSDVEPTPEIIEIREAVIEMTQRLTEIDVNDESEFDIREAIEAEERAGLVGIANIIRLFGHETELGSGRYELANAFGRADFNASVEFKDSNSEDGSVLRNIGLAADKPGGKFLWKKFIGSAYGLNISGLDLHKFFGSGYVRVGERHELFTLLDLEEEFITNDLIARHSDPANYVPSEMLAKQPSRKGEVGHLDVVKRRIQLEAFRNNLVDLSLLLLASSGMNVEIRLKEPIERNGDTLTQRLATDGLQIIQGGSDDEPGGETLHEVDGSLSQAGLTHGHLRLVKNGDQEDKD